MAHATGSTTPFNPSSDDDVAALIDMYREYLLEGLDRVGYLAPGLPAAAWLNTFIVRVNGHAAGFCSADTQRYAIELIYTSPEYRGRGLASQLLTDLSSTCPQPMRLKLPLSPGGEALAKRLGIGLSHPDVEEIRRAEHLIDDLHRTINQHCTHKRIGDPRKPCMRCYRRRAKPVAEAAVMPYVVAARAAGMLRAA
ncbi:hypothetical protein IX27_00340 [Streptomyces sp. JS01]|uniref:GNAT family N-acetyltransferase n=1 Tax=Streptomyces sp. JS01 TaxID=1525753 RepID=UPI0005019A11|nr:GNAT family N-acetyltransferase [Streptomyces sp. JS01]KFK91515.1 hypothetical protein IX27_00340 [Streptomyces sp. JS01]